MTAVSGSSTIRSPTAYDLPAPRARHADALVHESRRPSTSSPARSAIDLTASRARAVAVGGGQVARRSLLDDPAEDLLAVHRRSTAARRRSAAPGYALCRKTPHVVCSNFLPALGQPREWRNGRHALTPEAALELALREAPRAGRGRVRGVAPGAARVPRAVAGGEARGRDRERSKLPLKGTAVGAAGARRRPRRVAPRPASPPRRKSPPPDWVVPIRPTVDRPGRGRRHRRRRVRACPRRSSRSNATACGWSASARVAAARA